MEELLVILNKKSGVLGLSGGVSSDFRDLRNAANDGNEKAGLAYEAFCYRVAKYIGSYVAAMNGVDAIAFTAGLGENDANARKIITSYLTFMGVELDEKKNDVHGEEVVVSTDASKVKVVVVPTNEELAIARETLALV